MNQLTLRGDAFDLHINPDGSDVVLTDRARRLRWRLDEGTRLVARGVDRFDFKPYCSIAVARAESPVVLLGAGRAERHGDDTIVSEHHTRAGRVRLRWKMERDRVRIFAETIQGDDAATALALPGTFRPESERFAAVIPNCQGILHTGKGPAFYRPLCGAGHDGGCTMFMFGQIAGNAGLVVIAESDADVVLHWEKTDGGEVCVMWVQQPSMGSLSYEREAVIFSADGDATSVCKTYRRYVREKGRFRSWDEKIAQRPALEKLFGSALVFLGYFNDPNCNYADSLRQLKRLGIDKAVVYPMWCQSTFDIKAALAIQWTDTRSHAALATELGYVPGSFLYVVDGQRSVNDATHRDLGLDRNGKPILFWQINDQQWHVLSPKKAFAWTKRFLDAEHAELKFVHFDVLTSRPLLEDYHPAHRMDARSEWEWRRRVLEYAGSKGLIISSEGFCGSLTPYYDLGNSKYPLALGGEEYCVVPMTMLVYHDSAYHTWWEVDNYNNPQARAKDDRGFRDRFALGGGWVRQQACMDALMGTPPDIFPFGMQYGFVPHNRPQMYLYRFGLDDPTVREAIEASRPVMKLNQRIGKLEMIAHKLLRPDGAVQETIFADGTRVIANFANVALEHPDGGVLPPESWQMI